MDLHCTFCGTKFVEQTSWPRFCVSCERISYRNPIPVVVAMVPIVEGGWLIEQRAIEPQKGKWALPGGYVNHGESWQQAISRELEEEVGLATDPSDFRLEEIVNATNGNMLIFCSHDPVPAKDVKFSPNEEVSAIAFADDAELCFSAHSEMWKKIKDTSR